MKFMLLVYNDATLLDALPAGQADAMMRDCLTHADEMRHHGRLLQSEQLEDTSRAVRIRNGRITTVDGPFAEAKEVLGGFNIVEAENMDDALKMAAEFPWARTGRIEVRAVRDIENVRQRVFATAESTSGADA